MNRSPSARCTALTTTKAAAAVALTALLALAAGGCSAVDRAGGTAGKPVEVLMFAQPSGSPPDQLLAWADQVEQVSDGSLVIEFQNEWHGGDENSELATLDDVEEGRADLAWVGARAFDLVGVTDFQALLAPLAVDSHDLQQAVFDAGVPDEMLAGVEQLGVHGIAVLPGPMRKVLGIDHAFVSPDDFAGQVVGMQASAQTEETLTTLGATTKALPGGADISGVDGYEQQLSSIVGNGYYDVAGYVSANVNLWPRPLVIVANQTSYDGLSDEQRETLATATEQSMLAALDASRAEDADAVGELCAEGMQLVEASEDQLEELVHAVGPVYDRLLDDPKSAAWLNQIAQLKLDVAVGPDSADCKGQKASTAQGVLPNGTYRATLTKDAVLAGCQPGDPGAEAMLGDELTDRTLELEVSGTRITQFEYPVGRPQERITGWRGQYRTFRHTFELLEDGGAPPLASTFDFDGKTLLLTDMQTEYCDHKVVWTEHPWVLVEQDQQPASDELEGTWTTELTPTDWASAGVEGDPGIFTLIFEDGVVKVIDWNGEVGFRAHYDTFRGTLVTTGAVDELHATYELSLDTLTFTDLTIPGTDDTGPYGVVWTTHPFTRQD